MKSANYARHRHWAASWPAWHWPSCLSPQHFLHDTAAGCVQLSWVPTDQLSQYTLPLCTCLCKVDNITQITRYVAFVTCTGNHRGWQGSTGEDLPRPDRPVCKLLWRYVLDKLITRGINFQYNFLKISELISLLNYYEIFTITINTLLMICIQDAQHVKKNVHLQGLLALAQAITIVVTTYTTSDPTTPILFNETIILIYQGRKHYQSLWHPETNSYTIL